MKQINVNGKEVLMCEVPEGAKGFALIDMLNYQIMCYSVSTILGRGQDYKSLPKGSSWHLLGLASEIKEERWAELVEMEDGFKNKCKACYKHYNIQGGFEVVNTATESGLSLLKAHGYNPSQCILLIKK